ncbi:hypothetical protein GCK72_026125 [Caenorhabditis remanei]|uniref:Uncharacterized protein n=1 Tax=Caenorhabditis remanei TaxID=31234 RepID=A0A6A5G3Z7_CAERE|nr:hypothetical protein GCK72_026125 [Caenorhabditis remanei]KAF1749657.1 hypothetical protein GCK72_026125 [Caenorhabditis remanei]
MGMEEKNSSRTFAFAEKAVTARWTCSGHHKTKKDAPTSVRGIPKITNGSSIPNSSVAHVSLVATTSKVSRMGQQNVREEH